MKMFRRQSNVQDVCPSEAVDNLLASVKKEVKQIMEEAVTKKFIHEDSGSVTTLCGAVEACLKYKLKKQSLGLFKDSSSTTALLHKVAKTLEEAKETSRTVSDIESRNDPLSRFSFKNLNLDGTKTPPKQTTNGIVKYMWIRIALFNRALADIIAFLVKHSSKYYEPASLIADQSKGSLLSQLLEGPCALEYSRMKTSDHLYSDPNADELVLRHRLHSGASISSQTSVISPSKRPALGSGDILRLQRMRARCNTSSSSEESMRSVPIHAREYVESLHQNHKAKLLYGKNNVRVLPRNGDELLPGYLSLHHTYESLCLKWTPNQLINSKQAGASSTGPADQLHTHIEETTPTSSPTNSAPVAPSMENGHCNAGRSCSKQSSYDSNPSVRLLTKRPQLLWDCAISVNMNEIVYLHCHHQGSCGGILILVGVDGVQSPAFHFPFGGHLLAFLTCLESGLQPHAYLDPPLWIHKDTGRIFPKLRKKLSSSDKVVKAMMPTSDADIDYVFRIVLAYKPKSLHELIDPRKLSVLSLDNIKGFRLPWNTSHDSPSTTNSSFDMTTVSIQDSSNSEEAVPAKPPLQTRDSLQRLCSTMKQRILSRAFYGWLAHCKHLKTVREHLSGLVYSGEVINPVPAENEKYLTAEFWEALTDHEKVLRQFEIYRRIYYGGMSHSIRKQVWPYLLGHYKFGDTKSDRQKTDLAALRNYEETRDEWMHVEAVIKQRLMSKPKLSSRASADNISTELPMAENFSKHSLLDRQLSNLSNEVFMDTVIVAEVATEEFTQGTKRHAPLTKWHTYDSTYREDFCSVKMSTSYAGYEHRHHEMNGNHNDEPSPFPPSDDAAHKRNEALLEEMDLNLHRIDKDVHRCDRAYWYFTENNLKKLRNVMCTYVWRNLDVGYVQGMCDLVAPLLVIFDDESLTYSCFCELMKRMVDNFPNGRAMDNHLANMRSLIRVLDPELFDLMQHNGDYTHFFFCYRWLLLDFKREMCYDDVFLVWESIWTAKYVCSDNYVAFIALAMIEAYRDILLDNSMDFIDVMKFFNEMAEKHNAREVLTIARDLVFRLQSLIENK